MTRREMLMEQYENALFALLMDEVAESEGRKAIEENERLKEQGEPVISETSRQRCMKTIARKTTQQEVKRYGRAASRIITKVAVAVLVAMLLFTTAFASSENFRIKTLNFVIDTFDDRTELSLVTENITNTEQSDIPNISVGWLPNGFALVDEGKDPASAWWQYEAENGGMVSILAMKLDAGSLNVDTEASEMISIRLKGADAYLIEDSNITQVLWRPTGYPNWLCTATSQGINTEELIRIVENMEVK